MTEKHILHIEDNFHNRRIVRKILEKQGYVLHEAADGVIGYNMIQEFNPPLVLLDISLPGMDGIEIAQKIKADDKLKHIILIAVTASAMQGDREQFLAAGCDDYLSKPFRSIDLIELINQYFVEMPETTSFAFEPKEALHPIEEHAAPDEKVSFIEDFGSEEEETSEPAAVIKDEEQLESVAQPISEVLDELEIEEEVSDVTLPQEEEGWAEMTVGHLSEEGGELPSEEEVSEPTELTEDEEQIESEPVPISEVLDELRMEMEDTDATLPQEEEATSEEVADPIVPTEDDEKLEMVAQKIPEAAEEPQAEEGEDSELFGFFRKNERIETEAQPISDMLEEQVDEEMASSEESELLETTSLRAVFSIEEVDDNVEDEPIENETIENETISDDSSTWILPKESEELAEAISSDEEENELETEIEVPIETPEPLANMVAEDLLDTGALPSAALDEEPQVVEDDDAEAEGSLDDGMQLNTHPLQGIFTEEELDEYLNDTTSENEDGKEVREALDDSSDNVPQETIEVEVDNDETITWVTPKVASESFEMDVKEELEEVEEEKPEPETSYDEAETVLPRSMQTLEVDEELEEVEEEQGELETSYDEAETVLPRSIVTPEIDNILEMKEEQQPELEVSFDEAETVPPEAVQTSEVDEELEEVEEEQAELETSYDEVETVPPEAVQTSEMDEALEMDGDETPEMTRIGSDLDDTSPLRLQAVEQDLMKESLLDDIEPAPVSENPSNGSEEKDKEPQKQKESSRQKDLKDKVLQMINPEMIRPVDPNVDYDQV